MRQPAHQRSAKERLFWVRVPRGTRFEIVRRLSARRPRLHPSAGCEGVSGRAPCAGPSREGGSAGPRHAPVVPWSSEGCRFILASIQLGRAASIAVADRAVDPRNRRRLVAALRTCVSNATARVSRPNTWALAVADPRALGRRRPAVVHGSASSTSSSRTSALSRARQACPQARHAFSQMPQ
jgi:hypothetical protein